MDLPTVDRSVWARLQSGYHSRHAAEQERDLSLLQGDNEEVTGLQGTVRVSADRLGIGLYATDRYRFWFATETNLENRPGTIEATHDDLLPVIDQTTFVWVGLNPSTGDDTGQVRPSLRNVLFWAARSGASRVVGVNLFAHRHTDPSEVARHLRMAPEIEVIGPGNDIVLDHVATSPALQVLLGWGERRWLGSRGAEVAALFADPVCIGVGASGAPSHPGRKARDLPLMPYPPI